MLVWFIRGSGVEWLVSTVVPVVVESVPISERSGYKIFDEFSIGFGLF